MDYTTRKSGKEIRPGCVVGIGASAGGLEALQQFLTFLPSNTGMAFVIVQHLAPDHKSLLTDILGKYTTMPVFEAQDGMLVERNHVYMIPPKYNMEIEGDHLCLREYDHARINHPIDIFLRSLAKEYENRAVAVILSGTGSDGTNGIRSIKEQNGVIIVQNPDSAKFDGMPRNAIATGFVDLIQNPESIAREMAHISASMEGGNSRLMLTDDDLMAQVFSVLRNVTNINYTYYKQTTILRRIERRLVVTHNRNLQEYVNYLTNNPEEAKLLAKEVLIGVTCFFRDADYFDVLKERVIKKLLESSPKSRQIRVWVAGCSTGEEAYSIAILFEEAMAEMNLRRDIKIFATDLDPDAIQVAGKGVYGDNIIEDVNVSRLSRYFSRKGNKYVIRRDIREMIVFAQHNVFQDPPFGKLDLVSCRNLLIYFQTVLQRNLFAIFHIALNDGGYLFLGRSESVIDYDDVFRVLCTNEKIFSHYASGKAPHHDHFSYSMQTVESSMEPRLSMEKKEAGRIQYQASELETSALETLMPACVVVNAKNELWRSYGDTTRFLTIPVGNMTLDIFSLVQTDLKIAVSTALRESRRLGGKVTYDQVPVLLESEPEYISIVAQPIYDRHGAATEYTGIAFIRGKRELEGDVRQYQIDTAAAQQISNLETELKIAKEDLRKTVSELESVNAELQAANEELLTANEELQSSNEELQSVNEELYTVNSEYQSKVSELAGLNNDMTNFLSTTFVGILMVDSDLNIRKFTEYIASEFHVAEQDVGRSLRYIAYNFGTIDLMALCRSVLRTMTPIEKNCASVAGRTYLVRIAPYLTVEPMEDGNVETPSAAIKNPGNYSRRQKKKSTPSASESKLYGLVITFIDTTKQVDDQQQIEEMAKALRAAVQSGKEKDTFLSHMSHDMRTPMTAIFGLTQLSLEENGLSDTLRDNLQKILSSSNYLMNLIDEILETSRINAGKIVTVSTVVQEEQVSDDVSAIIGEKAREKEIHFQSHITGSHSRYVLMDVEHVERILMNLLGNAIKFTPAGGSVSFETIIAYSNEQVQHTYVIRDNGKGISNSFQEKMFLPFEQEETEPGLREGTGLGLYITRNLIDLLGGQVTCTSREGEGTEFRVVMNYNYATEDQIQALRRNVATYEDQVLLGRTILLAEDNHINAEVIIRILASRGIHAELARDGQEAIDLFRRKGPYYFQAILMDVMMPVVDGFEAAERIRRLDMPDARDIPIIALTADVSDTTEEKCYQAGMDCRIVKPVVPERLFAILADKCLENEEQQKGKTEKV